MKFSILIAHYNNWEYFQECYLSIKNQTYQNFEIIIVDDCSTDGSFEQLNKLSNLDHKIALYRNSKNKGVGFTKNSCLNHATGDILVFVDPDDALYPNALAENLNIYEKYKNIAVVYSQMMLCDSELNPINIFQKTRKIKNFDPYFVNIDTAVAHLFTFKKEKFELIENIDIDLKSAVDQDLYLKLYEVGEFKHIAKPLYYYRLHDKGVSQENNKSKAKDDFKKVIRKTLSRRNVKTINGKEITQLSDNQLYDELVKRENSFFRKLSRKLNL